MNVTFLLLCQYFPCLHVSDSEKIVCCQPTTAVCGADDSVIQKYVLQLQSKLFCFFFFKLNKEKGFPLLVAKTTMASINKEK